MTPNSTTTTDLYPSRIAPTPHIMERGDPTVWSDLDSPPDGPLSAEQLRDFDRDGFLFLEALFDGDEVRTYRDELMRLSNDEALRSEPITVLEPDHPDVRSIFDVHRHSSTFRQLAQDPRVASAARQILGSDVYIHQSRVNLKRAMHGAGFFWHSDFETWHVEDGMPRMRAVSAAVALTPNTEFNGPLMVVPGSHRSFVTCVGETPEGHYETSLRKQELGVPDEGSLRTLVEASEIVAPKGPAGSVLIFDCNIMHGSTENLSPYPRSNAFFVYNSVENSLGQPFGAAEPRPLFAAARDFTPVGSL